MISLPLNTSEFHSIALVILGEKISFLLYQKKIFLRIPERLNIFFLRLQNKDKIWTNLEIMSKLYQMYRSVVLQMQMKKSSILHRLNY